MKQIRWLFGILIFVVVGSAVAEPTVGFSDERIKAGVGEVFTIDIVMAGFPTTEGGGVSLHYDPSVIQVTGVSINEATWDFVNRAGTIDNTEGLVTDILFSSYTGVSGEATLATLEFQAVGRGKSALQLQESPTNPFASQGEMLAVELGRASVSVRGGRKEK